LKTILLDAHDWKTERDFYQSFLPQVGAPDWHGENLDALQESITDCDINEVNVPYRIVITRVSQASPEFRAWLIRLRALIDDLSVRDKVPVELEISE
jgi:RNAse (barnase) inhibitor barstar